MTAQANVPDQRIADVLCCAFEGGSNYWYLITRYVEPNPLSFRSDPDTVYRHLDYPLNEGGALVIRTLEGDEIEGKTSWTLDRAAIERGLQGMAAQYPDHFADVLNDNDDANTGDVFLQCCLFGSVVFG